jgi:hypothetical protein
MYQSDPVQTLYSRLLYHNVSGISPSALVVRAESPWREWRCRMLDRWRRLRVLLHRDKSKAMKEGGRDYKNKIRVRWIMMLALGKQWRLPFSPAARRSEPILHAYASGEIIMTRVKASVRGGRLLTRDGSFLPVRCSMYVWERIHTILH